MNIFVSVGTGLNQTQERLVAAVEERLRSEGLSPHTIGRNTFSIDTPLKAVTQLMDQCDGTVVIALERYFSARCIERRGSDKETQLESVSFPTVWNQIEAAMAYSRGHPLLVLVDKDLKADGLLERGNDWFVQRVDYDTGALISAEFNGILADWRDRVRIRADNGAKATAIKSAADLSVAELLSSLRPGQIWKVAVAIAGLIAGAFAIGAKLFG